MGCMSSTYSPGKQVVSALDCCHQRRAKGRIVCLVRVGDRQKLNEAPVAQGNDAVMGPESVMTTARDDREGELSLHPAGRDIEVGGPVDDVVDAHPTPTLAAAALRRRAGHSSHPRRTRGLTLILIESSLITIVMRSLLSPPWLERLSGPAPRMS
jgi:hypothetical protein